MATFSYEDIYELLRQEKYSTDLQKLNPEILRQIHGYLETKKKMLEKQQEDSEFSDKEKCEKLKLELENADRALRELYEKRERKTINRALFSSRVDFKLKDSSNMLGYEEKLYNELITLLRASFNNFQNSYNHLEFKKEVKKTNGTKIECKENIPKVKCSDLKEYGPFKEKEVVDVPLELAKVLIKQNKAIEL